MTESTNLPLMRSLVACIFGAVEKEKSLRIILIIIGFESKDITHFKAQTD